MSDSLYTARSDCPTKWLQRCLLVTWLVPCETAAISEQVLCTPYNPAPVHSVTIPSHSHTLVYVCLVVTCYLHFWQGDRAVLRATAVTRVWSGYRNMSQYGQLTQEKNILPPLLPGLEPETFLSQLRRSTTELSPLAAFRVLLNSTVYCDHRIRLLSA